MSLFGAQAAASQPSLFGTPQSAPSLFGGQSASTSLFGAPASSSSLFATPSSSASLFGAPASSSSLFGAPASSASLFGAPASSASLFGAPASSASLFGAPASSASLFGAPASSASLFGAPQQQQQQQQQQQAQQVQITGRTRISELPQNFQTDLLAVERHLREQRTKSSLLSSKRTGVDQNVSQTKARADNILRNLLRLKASLESLQTNADVLKAAVRTERRSAEPIVIAVKNFTRESRSGFVDPNGMRYGFSGPAIQRAAHVPEEYFSRILQEMEVRANEYKVEIDEIAEYLKSQGIVLGSTFGVFSKKAHTDLEGAAKRLSFTPMLRESMDISEPERGAEVKGKKIEDVIRRQYDYFMVVATNVAKLNETLRATREWFLRLLQARNPDGPNPFSQASLREKAVKDRHSFMAQGITPELNAMETPRNATGFLGSVGTVAPVQSSLFQPRITTGFESSTGGVGQNKGFTSGASGILGKSKLDNGAFGGTIEEPDRTAVDSKATRRKMS